MAEAKKNILTPDGLKALEDELQELKVVRRKEIAQKIKEAREQGDLSENAEYDAAKDEQRDMEARIEEIEKILKNAVVIDEKFEKRCHQSWMSRIIRRHHSWKRSNIPYRRFYRSRYPSEQDFQ